MTTTNRFIQENRNMLLQLRLALGFLVLALSLTGCVVYEPVPAMASAPASFDRSWNAALGAAQDVGIAVTAADRSRGLIQGRRNTANATITLIPQANGSLRVQFDAQGLGPQDQGLEDRFVQAYNRRMGR
jgi:hypothetical protein